MRTKANPVDQKWRKCSMKKNIRLYLSGLLMVLLLGSYAIADQELDYVKQAIAAKGGKWHAG